MIVTDQPSCRFHTWSRDLIKVLWVACFDRNSIFRKAKIYNGSYREYWDIWDIYIYTKGISVYTTEVAYINASLCTYLII